VKYISSYKKYTLTQNSSVSWLGVVPSHWKLLRLKNIFHIHKNISGELGHDVLSITQKGIKLKDTTSGDGQLSMDYSKYQLVSLGDFAMNHMDLLTGYVDISSFAGVTSPDYRVFKLIHQESVPRFWLYILQLCYKLKIFYPLGQGAAQIGRWRLPAEGFNQFVSAVPTQDEQQKIANFLDHETAKIDTLIEKQQQLIKLLKEKRQAVISQAVTKGLNPDAPMKDSGVEWLGEVPEHWSMRKFKHVSRIVRGGSPRPAGDPLLFNGSYSPWVTVAEITGDEEIYLKQTDSFLTKLGSEQCRVFKTGTLLYSNSGATLGVPKILAINANANDGVVGFEKLSVDITYAYYFLLFQTADLRERTKQGSGQPNLNTDIVGNMEILLPPKEEVEEILQRIDQFESAYKMLLVLSNSTVSKLQERRTALISAAVTGKIDVRNWQPPEPTSTPSTDA